MKKLVLVVCGLAVLVVLGLPPVLGLIAERQANARAETVAGSGELDVALASYERGWFTSKARAELSLEPDSAIRIEAMLNQGPPNAAQARLARELSAALGEPVTLEVEITHGPLIWGGGASLGVARTVTRLRPDDGSGLQEALNVPYLFEIRAVTGLSGISRFQGDVPPVEIVEAGQQLSFSGVTLQGTYDFARRQLNGEASMDSLELGSDAAAFTIREVSARGDLEGFLELLWAGEAEARVGRVAVSVPLLGAGPVLEIADLAFHGHIRPAEGSASTDMEFTGSVASLSAPGDSRLRDATLKLAFRDLDAEALQTYYRVSRTRPATRAAQAAQRRAAQQDVLYALLASSPSLEISPLAFLWNENAFSATIRVEADAGALPAKDAFAVQRPAGWTQYIDAQADIDIAKDLAHWLAAEAMKRQLVTAMESGYPITRAEIEARAEAQTPQMLSSLVRFGLMKETESSYLAELSFTDGMFSAGGLPVPLPVF